MFLLVILIGLGLVCFVKLNEEGFTRMGFMVAYLAFIITLIKSIY
ncbi:hypothetical protein [Tissierella simiarum]|nr:hypothetical protein [Tissierella simiarum]